MSKKSRVSWSLRKARTVLFLLMFIALPLLNCGKKGDPRPPEATAPDAVRYLSAEGRVDGIILSWQAPEATGSGEDLPDLAGFRIQRSDYEEDERPDFEDIGEILVSATEELSAGEGGEGLTSGAVSKPKTPVEQNVRYTFRDPEVQPGRRYEYVVLPFNERGVEGEFTQVLRIRFTGESSLIENLSSGQ